jgi:ribosomal protein RSM22 (predicted rRNA methylase)
MELPPALREAIDRALGGRRPADLAATAAALSQRYRDERRDGRPHVASDEDALAYIAVRLPATYAAVRASFAAIKQARPDFAPKSALDIGAGPGTALWAAADCWPDLADALLIEASRVFRSCGEALAREASLPPITWRTADVATDAIDCAPRDLVTLAYALNELTPQVRQPVLQRLWLATADTLVIVEPGTPAGWQRITAARAQLIAAGAHRSRHARMCTPARSSRRTGVISPNASPARVCIGSPRRRSLPGRTRSSATWRSHASLRPLPRRASLRVPGKGAAVSR